MLNCNCVKISYSCMPIMAFIIKSHNAKVGQLHTEHWQSKLQLPKQRPLPPEQQLYKKQHCLPCYHNVRKAIKCVFQILLNNLQSKIQQPHLFIQTPKQSSMYETLKTCLEAEGLKLLLQYYVNCET